MPVSAAAAAAASPVVKEALLEEVCWHCLHCDHERLSLLTATAAALLTCSINNATQSDCYSACLLHTTTSWEVLQL